MEQIYKKIGKESVMKAVLSGRLIKKPELKNIVLQDGREEVVCNYRLWIADPSAPVRVGNDGRSHKADIPFSCTAWGDNARYVAAKNPGDILTGSYTMRYSEIRSEGSNKMLVNPTYVIRRIDPENKIHKQMSEMLSGYENGTYDDIGIQEPQPAFGDKELDEPQPSKENALAIESEPDIDA